MTESIEAQFNLIADQESEHTPRHSRRGNSCARQAGAIMRRSVPRWAHKMAVGVQTSLFDQDPDLREIVRRLTVAYEPGLIYLFGSKARGDAGPDSDYDLMLVVPDDAPRERRRSQLAYQALRGIPALLPTSWYAPGHTSTPGDT
jgi:hypothetical protein